MKLRIPLGIFVFAGLAATSAFASIERTVEKRFDVRPGGLLKVDTINGSVSVKSTKDDAVHIVLRERIEADSDAKADELLNELVFVFEQTGSDVTATAKRKHEGSLGLFGHWHQKVRLEWQIDVPERYNVNLDTAGGAIKVGDLTGDVMADTSGGGIDVGSIVGNVKADTSGGHIHLAAATGKADLDTSGGSIRVGKVGGAARLDTSGGSITVDAASAGVKADTSGGSIDVTFDGALKDDVNLDTSAGSITVRLDSSSAFDLVADTSAGSITCEIPIEAKGERSKDHLEGKANGGGHRLRLDTSAGGIRILKR